MKKKRNAALKAKPTPPASDSIPAPPTSASLPLPAKPASGTNHPIGNEHASSTAADANGSTGAAAGKAVNPMLNGSGQADGASSQQTPDRLHEMVDAAEILIVYACRNAVKPKELEDGNFKRLIQEIISGRDAIRAGHIDSMAEAEFLENFRRLSRALAPVTVRSIQDSVWEEGRSRLPVFLPKVPRLPMSRASAAIARFTFVSVVALAFLLAAQVMWLIGFALLTQIKELKDDTLVAGAKARGSDFSGLTFSPSAAVVERAASGENAAPLEPVGALGEEDPPLPPEHEVTAKAPVRRDSAELAIEALHRTVQLSAAFTLLLQWWDFWPGTSQPDTILDPGAFNNSVLISSSSVVNILEVYVLPLLYGLMGACTYVLRQLIVEMRERMYRSEAEISYWVRIFLGLLSGLAIGWFLRPDTHLGAEDGATHGDLLSRLPPFALSYVAGYSVELLFSAMDRLVLAFGATSQNSKS